MELWSWVVDFFEFFGGVIALFLLFFGWKLITGSDTAWGMIRWMRGRRNNGYRSGGGNEGDYYRNDDSGYNSGNPNQYSSDYSNSSNEESEDSGQYQGLNGTGEFAVNGSFDEPLDYSNPNMYPVMDSFDSNSDENKW